MPSWGARLRFPQKNHAVPARRNSEKQKRGCLKMCNVKQKQKLIAFYTYSTALSQVLVDTIAKMLRSLTYFLGALYPGLYYRSIGFPMILFIIAHLGFFGTLTDVCTTVVAFQNYTLWSPLIAFLGALCGWTITKTYGFPRITQKIDKSGSEIDEFSWSNIGVSFLLMLFMEMPFVFYDLDLWEGQWYSYLATGGAMFVVCLLAYIASVYLIPSMALAYNARKIHTIFWAISILTLVIDAILVLASSGVWDYLLSFIMGGVILLFVTIMYFAGGIRPAIANELSYDDLSPTKPVVPV